jgi:hypothetical protein
MFRKLTPFEHHKSFMPFDYLFMTKDEFKEFCDKTKPADTPVVVEVKTEAPSIKVTETFEGLPVITIPNINNLTLYNTDVSDN